MCGINGVLELRQEGSFGSVVAAMNDALSHRGPDDHGIHEAAGLALGQRRLSIIDLSSAGRQPMHSADGRYTIIYNGELYNYRELRRELGEQEFRTATDTEVLLVAYARWGVQCLDRFNGMFAFAVWDRDCRRLFIARDRLGIKPLYYHHAGPLLIFSSEVRAILASEKVPRKVDEAALGDYLRYQTVHAPATIVQGVRMLMPGQYLLAHEGRIDLKTWWQLPGQVVQPHGENPDPAVVRRQVRALLRGAVERRLVADVPFGAFLSGGIDSSAIVALMSEVARGQTKTFSVVFDESEFSEARYARLVARKFGTEHHELRLTPGDFLHTLPQSLQSMDHPSGDGVNSYVVSKATKNAGITMALSGLGGDELFGGYDIFARAMALRRRRWLNGFPHQLRRLGGAALRTLRPGITANKIAAVLSLPHIGFDSAYPLARRVLFESQIAAITRCSLPASTGLLPLPDALAGREEYLLRRVSIYEIGTYMQNVLLRDTDQMSMAHALEVRVPFLDYTLVEYVLSLPDYAKPLHPPKHLLVEALRDLLPREIVDRPKMGFTLPWELWLKNELNDFCAQHLRRLGQRRWFDAEGVERLWQSFLRGDPQVSWSRLWPLVVLEYWLEHNGFAD
jgi:asparagine synthase (glutamine-hydrolysing)